MRGSAHGYIRNLLSSPYDTETKGGTRSLYSAASEEQLCKMLSLIDSGASNTERRGFRKTQNEKTTGYADRNTRDGNATESPIRPLTPLSHRTSSNSL